MCDQDRTRLVKNLYNSTSGVILDSLRTACPKNCFVCIVHFCCFKLSVQIFIIFYLRLNVISVCPVHKSYSANFYGIFMPVVAANITRDPVLRTKVILLN